MDNNNLQPPQSGRGGRPLHIAHRRSPSEMTPLMSTSPKDHPLPPLQTQAQLTPLQVEQLAIQQQIDLLQQQQNQILAASQQFANMGMMQQQMPGQNFAPGQMSNLSPQPNAFQFPQQFQGQQVGMQMNQSMHSHRRNQSAMPGMAMGGPPPAPSSGASGSAFAGFDQQSRENINPRGRGSGPPGSGHTRRHSLALPEAKKAAELAEQKRKTSAFQFPLPGAGAATSTSPGPGQSSSPASAEAHAGSTSTPTRNVSGHGRSQSMAVGNGRGGSAPRGGGNFSFPAAPQPDTSDFQRRGSGHGRSASRNFEGNWRQPQTNVPPIQEQQQQPSPMGSFQMNQAPGTGFQPGHRARGSVNQSISNMGAFQYPNQQMMQMPQGQMLMQQPQMFNGQGGLNPVQLAQLQALQTAQASGQAMPGLQMSQHAGPMSAQQQQQQQRKTLFTPYLPQASLPALLSDGHLVAGTLRVNKKNRSDAYVTTTDLDADIFICGSKDRNRALEGDLVAIELLDVDEVWGQKREKEEKKKRKDIVDSRHGAGSNTTANDATTGGDANGENGLRRRGSLRQRPTQKKNDDVEVEGQSLLLMEEEEINDEQKPLYAGHVVAVIERVAGQMFSGTLGLLRPSSQATKEKQEAERSARDGGNSRHNDRAQDKPKIVWFKPTDKRVPLIAIPTEQAPRDFVEKHMDYANRIFVACIKRWPITSLHPFGTLVEQLGEMGDLKVETDALLRDNNFGPDDFSDAVLKSVGFEDWSVAKDGETGLQNRRDFRSEQTFTIDPNGAKELDDAIHVKTLADGNVEIGMHVADVAHFIKANSLVDREAKKRGTGVYLINRTVNMLPSRLSADVCCLSPGEDRYTVSVVFTVNPTTGQVAEDDVWVGKGVIKSTGKLTYDDADAIIAGQQPSGLGSERLSEVKTLYQVASKLRQARFGNRMVEAPALRLLYQLDDENVPVEQNIFNTSPAHELIEEVSQKVNAIVAKTVFNKLGEKTWLRRQAAPNPRRLQTFADRMTRLGYDIDASNSGDLQNSLFSVEDPGLRKGMETLLFKTMRRAQYCVAGRTVPEDLPHFALNLPLYTHFTNPSRRYADIIVHRQLEVALSEEALEFNDDIESLAKTAELCNTKKDSAQVAQEQSVHIESCRGIDRLRNKVGGDLICEGIVLCVYESAFDVLIPEYGFEKRVHCDQLPLKKAEFDKHKRILELYWEKGVVSSAFVPEDERSKGGITRGGSTAQRESEAARQAHREAEENRRRQLDTGGRDNDDLFDDDDDDDDVSDVTEMTAGVSLGDSKYATKAEPELQSAAKTAPAADTPEGQLGDKDRFRKFFSLREAGGDYIQDVTELSRVPVILKTDLTKSPPCLTIRSVNPYAL